MERKLFFFSTDADSTNVGFLDSVTTVVEGALLTKLRQWRIMCAADGSLAFEAEVLVEALIGLCGFRVPTRWFTEDKNTQYLNDDCSGLVSEQFSYTG